MQGLLVFDVLSWIQKCRRSAGPRRACVRNSRAADSRPGARCSSGETRVGKEVRQVFIFVIYVDQGRQWRWRLWTTNKRVIADSGEGYHNRQDCEHAVQLMKQYVPTAEVQVKQAA